MTTAPEWKVVAGTGHRPQYLSTDETDWARAQLPTALRRLRKHHGTRIIVSGLALGWDTWLAQAALGEGLELHAHIPFPQQAAVWRPADRDLWRNLQKHATQVVFYGNDYNVRLLHARNDGMLDVADAVFALWDESKTKGGTYGAIVKALNRGLPILHADPVGRTLDRLTRVPRGWRPPALHHEHPGRLF